MGAGERCEKVVAHGVWIGFLAGLGNLSEWPKQVQVVATVIAGAVKLEKRVLEASLLAAWKG